MPPASLHIRFVVPGNVRHNSGGNVYNAELARELAALGATVEICPLDGDWPGGRPEDRRRLAGLLQRAPAAADATGGFGRGASALGSSPLGDATPLGSVTLVDSLLACGAPDEIEAAAAAGQPAWILLHMPLPDRVEQERRALRAAAGVICTGRTAAAGIADRHGLDHARVALPGTAPTPVAAGSLAAGSGVPHFIAVAALLPNKDQSLLLDALSLLADLSWTASLVGSDTSDASYAAQLRRSAARSGLAGRVSITGELRGPELEAAWGAADLSLLISRAETYGLAVTESLARGVPVVVREGTGAVEALAAGSPPPSPVADSPAAGKPGPNPRPGTSGPKPLPCVPPEPLHGVLPDASLPGAAVCLGTDPAPLADLLRRWLEDPGLRERWRAAAVSARGRLPGWDATARTVLGHLTGTPGHQRALTDSAPGQAVAE